MGFPPGETDRCQSVRLRALQTDSRCGSGKACGGPVLEKPAETLVPHNDARLARDRRVHAKLAPRASSTLSRTAFVAFAFVSTDSDHRTRAVRFAFWYFLVTSTHVLRFLFQVDGKKLDRLLRTRHPL
jgi:hypothetical protein